MKDPIREYMERLRAALGSLSSQEQEQILSEVESHFAAGLEDKRLGATPEDRRGALMREMGDPQNFGHELKQLKRRQRWLDFLLATIPALFLAEIIEIVVMRIYYPSASPLFNEAALATLPLYTVMFLVARWRASQPLLIFWLLIMLDKALIALQWSILGSPQLPFALLWGVVCLATLAWLLRVLWQVRRIPLLLVFGSLPLLLALVESAPVLQGLAALLPVATDIPGIASSRPYLSPGATVLSTALTLVSLALFFVARGRPLRWFGVGLFVSAPSIANTLFFGLNGGNSYLILVLPITALAVGAGILLEQISGRRFAPYSR